MCRILQNRLLVTIILWAMFWMTHSAVADTSTVKSTESNQSIVLLLGQEQDLTGCRLLGKVTGASEDSDNDLSYPERLIIARDNIRSATAELGGNAIHIIRTVNTARYEVPGVDKKIIFSGNAYYCE